MPAHRARQGFALVEAMVAMSIAAVALLGAVSLFTAGLESMRRQRVEFLAFSIAQQSIELLSSVPIASPLLTSSTTGAVTDPSPNAGVDGPAVGKRQVNELGDPSPTGAYTVYWKIENTTGEVRDVRVYVRYPSSFTVNNYVVLETFR